MCLISCQTVWDYLALDNSVAVQSNSSYSNETLFLLHKSFIISSMVSYKSMKIQRHFATKKEKNERLDFRQSIFFSVDNPSIFIFKLKTGLGTQSLVQAKYASESIYGDSGYLSSFKEREASLHYITKIIQKWKGMHYSYTYYIN